MKDRTRHISVVPSQIPRIRQITNPRRVLRTSYRVLE
jgi:hypothetical protein